MNRGLFGAFSGRGGSSATGLSPIWESFPASKPVVVAVSSTIWTHNIGFRPKFFQVGARNFAETQEYSSFLLVDSIAGTYSVTPWASLTQIGFNGGNTDVAVPNGFGSAHASLTGGSWYFFARIFG